LLRRSRKTVKTGSDIKIGELVIDLQAREVRIADEKINLTQTEFDVLSYLGQNRDRVLARDQIFQSVWGYNSEFASNSLDVLIYRIRAKLKAVGGHEYIATVRGYGFRLRASTE
jgi:DNA-binding response OmpR family regulator